VAIAEFQIGHHDQDSPMISKKQASIRLGAAKPPPLPFACAAVVSMYTFGACARQQVVIRSPSASQIRRM
jgi:hypothetical protein